MKFMANPIIVDAEIIVAVGPVLKDGGIDMTLQGGQLYHASAGQTSRYIPQKGDYIVTQEDGYVYLNPKGVFERKYSAVVWDSTLPGWTKK